jgi:hypothetical protein
VPELNPDIEMLFVFDPSTGETRVVFESSRSDPDRASELWRETATGDYFLYHPDEYYDDKLRWNRNTDNMRSPGNNRLQLIGVVWGALTYDKSVVILGRTQLIAGKSQ